TVIDRKTIFVGSLNFDPRSILINTEMGLFIESSDLGAVFTVTLFQSLSQTTYKVELDEKDQLRWTYHDGDQHEVLHHEPQASWGRRFMAGFYGILPIEGQL
ncbi:MAG: phospholipase D-like domain-containing protein, partial [Gammaproteobacteria bacterium]|nr:phospholipase D-like domain-containing protein [Gammaproteobacteria bacterium]